MNNHRSHLFAIQCTFGMLRIVNMNELCEYQFRRFLYERDSVRALRLAMAVRTSFGLN